MGNAAAYRKWCVFVVCVSVCVYVRVHARVCARTCVKENRMSSMGQRSKHQKGGLESLPLCSEALQQRVLKRTTDRGP